MLFLERESIVRHEPDTGHKYPEQIEVNGIRLPLAYRFQPGSTQDGITVTVPVQLLNQLDAQAFERLVPGLLEEKVISLLRALPKQWRRQFVPVPDTARRCMTALQSAAGALPVELSACLLRLTGVEVPVSAWQSVELPDHLRPRFRVVDPEGQTLAVDRDYAALREQLQDHVADSFSATTADVLQRDQLTAWDFGDLPQVIDVEQQGFTLQVYPALVDCGDSVALRCLDTRAAAGHATQAGLRRLFMLALRKELRYLARNLPGRDALCLAYSRLGRCEDLVEEILQQVVQQACMPGRPDIRSQEMFQQRLEAGRPQLVSLANEWCALLQDILQRQAGLRAELSGSVPPARLAAVQDMRDQLDHLVYPGFVLQTPAQWIVHVPRYLEAVARRLQRLQQDPQKDRQLVSELAPWWNEYLGLHKLYAEQDSLPPALVRYRWLLEEYRVSLFAQELKTSEPVSAKRLATLRKELRKVA